MVCSGSAFTSFWIESLRSRPVSQTPNRVYGSVTKYTAIFLKCNFKNKMKRLDAHALPKTDFEYSNSQSRSVAASAETIRAFPGLWVNTGFPSVSQN